MLATLRMFPSHHHCQGRKVGLYLIICSGTKLRIENVHYDLTEDDLRVSLFPTKDTSDGISRYLMCCFPSAAGPLHEDWTYSKRPFDL